MDATLPLRNVLEQKFYAVDAFVLEVSKFVQARILLDDDDESLENDEDDFDYDE